MIGWIYRPDTTINYPVVQGDDNAYYLKHLADGTENRNGCPFLDVQNRPDFTDDNSIIYGHHMQNGTMSAGISWYEDQSYYDEHPVMYLMTPSATYRIELFSGYITTMDSSAYMQTFGGIREHTDWLKDVSGRSDFRANLEISAYDRVIRNRYSTCWAAAFPLTAMVPAAALLLSSYPSTQKSNQNNKRGLFHQLHQRSPRIRHYPFRRADALPRHQGRPAPAYHHPRRHWHCPRFDHRLHQRCDNVAGLLRRTWPDLMRFRPVFTIMYVLNGLCEWIESPVLMDPQLMIKTDHPL